MPLTDTAVRNFRPAAKGYKKSDFNGLYIYVTPKGLKTWRYDYTYLGSRKTHTIGPYPGISLAQARQLRDEAKAKLSQLVDPAQDKRNRIAALLEEKRQQVTFEEIAQRYIDKRVAEGIAPDTLTKNKWLAFTVCAPISKTPIAALRPREIYDFLHAVELSGRTNTAREARAFISRVCAFGVAIEACETDPAAHIGKALIGHTTQSFAAVTHPEDIGALVHAIKEDEGGHFTTRNLLLAHMYLFTRPSETRTMMWEELDMERKVWTIPAPKTKLRRPLDVPLARQVIEIIERMRPLTGHTPIVFKSMYLRKSYLSENTMNKALRRLGFSGTDHVSHGFRSTASTVLNESGQFRSEAIEAQLAHLDPNKVRKVYNRAEYWDERVPMMQWYADYLDGLPKPAEV